jgi:hypothetical protein
MAVRDRNQTWRSPAARRARPVVPGTSAREAAAASAASAWPVARLAATTPGPAAVDRAGRAGGWASPAVQTDVPPPTSSAETRIVASRAARRESPAVRAGRVRPAPNAPRTATASSARRAASPARPVALATCAPVAGVAWMTSAWAPEPPVGTTMPGFRETAGRGGVRGAQERAIPAAASVPGPGATAVSSSARSTIWACLAGIVARRASSAVNPPPRAMMASGVRPGTTAAGGAAGPINRAVPVTSVRAAAVACRGLASPTARVAFSTSVRLSGPARRESVSVAGGPGSGAASTVPWDRTGATIRSCSARSGRRAA